MKINIGSNKKNREGFINLDILDLPNVHIIQDLTDPPYYYRDELIDDDSVDEILMEEVLEHIPFREVGIVLDELYRILKPGGKMHICVPDIGKMCEYYVKDKISDLIPHKGDKNEIIKLQKATGKMINPNRWIIAFTGAQKHKYDTHLNHFTEESLYQVLDNCGFSIINKGDDIGWKLKFDAYK